MKTKTILLLLLTACLIGCQSVPVTPEDTQVFKNWKECFRFMGSNRNYMLAQDDDTLFKLAAESSMAWFWLQEGTNRIVIVIKPDSLNGPYSAIRGAQGNGLYYLFTPVARGFQFVGRMEGNGYKWGTLNGKARFITGWHWSASQSYENVYDWDGKMFRQTSHILYQYDPDGSRKEIEEPNYVPKDTAPKLADPRR